MIGAMILSFHPLIPGEENINCAGRPPGPREKEAVSRAQAVILPQGVREDLYRLCRALCPLVWPNYDVRFDYPGKVGQSLLFAAHGLNRPRTVVYPSTADFHPSENDAEFRPYVLKSNFGGQGGGVFRVTSPLEEAEALRILESLERSGWGGFIRQEIIDHGGRDLRVVLLGSKAVPYWRCAPPGETFYNNLSLGGRTDFNSDPDLMEQGVRAVRDFAGKTGIDLAAFDLMFDRTGRRPGPLFIEINDYFGRSALGGSMIYYRMLKRAATRWLKEHGLKRGPIRTRPVYSRED